MKLKLSCEKCSKTLLSVDGAKMLDVGEESVKLIYTESVNKHNDIICNGQHNPGESVIVCPECGHIEDVTGINFIE